MSLIRVANNLASNSTKTFISDPVTAGGTSFPVKNTNTFVAQWAIQVGNVGEERSEIKLIDNVSGLNIRTTGTATFDHPTDTPVYAIKYNQVVFKRSTSGTAGTATALSSGTVTIQPDQEFTQFDDSSAQAGYAYKASFRNSISGDESSDSDWLSIEGYPFYSRAKLRERIKEKLYDPGFIKDDETINNWINEWLEQMNNAAVHVNKDYSLGTVDVAFGTSGLGTVTSSNFKEIRKVDVTYDGNNFYTANRISQTDFTPTQQFISSYPCYYPFGNNIYGFKPSDQSGTARISFYTISTSLDSDADELPLPMRSYTKSFVNYGLAQALQIDDKAAEAKEKMKEANNDLSLFLSDITPRSNSGPRFVKLTDDITGDGQDIIY